MEYVQIRNSRDLKAEILRLEGVSKVQSEVLRSHFAGPAATFSTIFSLIFKPNASDDEKNGGIFSQDFVGMISRFILPLTLNRTIFRNSNILVKALVGLVSQKASHFITEDSVSNIWHKIKDVVEEHSDGVIQRITSMFEKKQHKRSVNHPKHVAAHANTIKG